jgi:hypothetical protein
VRTTGVRRWTGGYFLVIQFDPDAPEVSAEVPLLTGSNLHEIVNGLDRPETQAMPMDELHQLVSQEFGEHSKAIIDAYRRDYPQAIRLTYMPPLLRLLFVARHVNRQSGRLLFVGHPRTPTYMAGALRYWTDAPGHFMPLSLRLLSTMLSSVITTVEAVVEQLSYQNKSVLLG